MKIQFGDTGNTPESRAQMIRDLFTEGRTVPAHTDFCMNRGLWTEAENYAAALRQHQAEVRDALGELTAEGIPFAELTRYDVPTLYSLKGEIVRRGVKAVTGIDMPIFPKRRFQHGAMPEDAMRRRLAGSEADYRRAFDAIYA